MNLSVTPQAQSNSLKHGDLAGHSTGPLRPFRLPFIRIVTIILSKEFPSMPDR